MSLHRVLETYRGHTVPHLRLIEHRNWWFTFSGILIVLSLFGLFVSHLNLSIDFEGGQEISYISPKPVTAEQVTAILSDVGVSDATVQIANGIEVSIRTESLAANQQRADEVMTALAKETGIDREAINLKDVGPTWGAEISSKALRGLIIVLTAITLYIALRFEWKMALGAMIALVHDVVITAGIYALSGREVTPETVIAILTILGFSLYDTVVIYDKVKENTESTALIGRYGYSGVVNLSLNQVLMRSVNTSLVVLLPILSLLLFGGQTLKDFALAMFIGVAIGAYSSIFIAAPVLAVLKEREPKYRQMEARRAVRESKEMSRSEAAASSTAEADGSTRQPRETEPAPAATAAAATRTTARTGGQRPRPKSKRRPPAKRRRR